MLRDPSNSLGMKHYIPFIPTMSGMLQLPEGRPMHAGMGQLPQHHRVAYSPMPQQLLVRPPMDISQLNYENRTKQLLERQSSAGGNRKRQKVNDSPNEDTLLQAADTLLSLRRSPTDDDSDKDDAPQDPVSFVQDLKPPDRQAHHALSAAQLPSYLHSQVHPGYTYGVPGIVDDARARSANLGPAGDEAALYVQRPDLNARTLQLPIRYPVMYDPAAGRLPEAVQSSSRMESHSTETQNFRMPEFTQDQFRCDTIPQMDMQVFGRLSLRELVLSSLRQYLVENGHLRLYPMVHQMISEARHIQDDQTWTANNGAENVSFQLREDGVCVSTRGRSYIQNLHTVITATIYDGRLYGFLCKRLNPQLYDLGQVAKDGRPTLHQAVWLGCALNVQSEAQWRGFARKLGFNKTVRLSVRPGRHYKFELAEMSFVEKVQQELQKVTMHNSG